MPTIDPQRVKRIFAEAIDRPPAERAAFVESACAGDADLRSRVERLLRMHDTAGEFLVEPTGGFASRFAGAGESVGDVIGNYTLLELIGEGGFGTVYLAEQQRPVRRRVALKIIKLGMDTRQVIARFDAEKQALAMMDHPGIARVFDAGATETGRPYFVMEFVPGEPITRFCDRHNLSPARRLELFVSVCAAVQHAHQKGIIHRDIKPTNVLVSEQDGEPQVKVIDFGIAKATEARLTEKTVFTEERHMIGTPQYMSPEQAGADAADVDTRADIYSLGVLLYELLTGCPPFDPKRLRSAALGEIQRIIREEDPPRPSTRLSALGDELTTVAHQRQSEPMRLTRLVRGDLDWIVMKAMEKDRARRYETASALADDIARHLSDRPVTAGPPSATYRIGKFVRRHRTGVVAGALVATALVAGTTFATIGFVRASRARADAEAKRLIAERQTRIAEEVNSFLTNDLLAAADPNNRGRTVTVLEVLDAASKAVEGRFEGAPVVEAAVRSTLGNTFWRLGELQPAEGHFVRALELHRQHLGEEHPETLTSMNRLAGIYRAQGRLDEAEPIYLDVLDRRRRLLGPEHTETLSSMHNLAGLFREQGRFEDALPIHQQALEISRRTLPPGDPQRLNMTEGLAGMYKDMGRYPDAEQLYVEVLAAHRAAHDDRHPRTLRTMNNLAIIQRRLGRFEQAETLYRETLQTQRELLTDDHPSTLITMTNLAKLYVEMKRYDQAEALYTEALERSRRVLGDDHRGTLITRIGLAETYSMLGRMDEAETTLLEAMRHVSPDDAFNAAMLKNALAILYLGMDRAPEALALATDAVAAAREGLPEGHWFIGQYQHTRGRCLLKLDRFGEAESALLDAHKLLSAAVGPDDDFTKDTAASLVRLYETWGKPDEAAKWRGTK